MSYRLCLRLAVILTAIALLVASVQAWRADRRDRAQIAAELASTKQLLAAANARQRDRDAQLAQTLSVLEAQKRAILTADQIVRRLQKNIPLPEPITLQATPLSSEDRSGTISETPIGKSDHRSPSAATPAAFGSTSQTTGDKSGPFVQPAQASVQAEAPNHALIPRADLKPLYDFTLDCQACQAKLSTAQNDLADEKSKTAALTKERDAAVSLAKGGTGLRRILCAAKWFVLGAAVGAIAAKTH